MCTIYYNEKRYTSLINFCWRDKSVGSHDLLLQKVHMLRETVIQNTQGLDWSPIEGIQENLNLTKLFVCASLLSLCTQKKAKCKNSY
jgi:hypothetical protein